MTKYKIEINEILENNSNYTKKSGIWAKIKNIKTGEIINRHIWWRDKEGIMHDGTTELPVKLRDQVDNAWLDYRRI